MADWAWTNGRLSRVVHPVGKFSNGEDRYRRAQFDYLAWDITGTEQQYVLVPNADYQHGVQESINSAVQQHEAGAAFGFYDGSTKIMEAEGSDDTESINGLHSFGLY